MLDDFGVTIILTPKSLVVLQINGVRPVVGHDKIGTRSREVFLKRIIKRGLKIEDFDIRMRFCQVKSEMPHNNGSSQQKLLVKCGRGCSGNAEMFMDIEEDDVENTFTLQKTLQQMFHSVNSV